ncbi:unnamed protein product [marine sediment metagenome]|uniref:Uncharacterized protein n=1 Tax=marine sediment metagenome TaxID=412755 RepID=X1N4M2_9ZZZZ
MKIPRAIYQAIEFISRWGSLTEEEKQESCMTILNYFVADYSDEDGIAALAEALANSGKIYKWPLNSSQIWH